MSDTDTIAAVATPPGRGGVGIVRISGPQVVSIARALLGSLPAPRRATFRMFRDASGQAIDEGLALYFPAPNSFTGEDVMELQGHGGPVVLDLVLQAALAQGARLARPGEFSERAFLNDKLDLAQAEAVADLIEAGSAQAARSALHSLQGEFSQRVHALVAQVIEVRSYVEAAIDFPEEEVDFLGDGEVTNRLGALQLQLAAVLDAARQGSLLREGMHIVLAGQPNAGKSSLLNALAGRESAIVTSIPGTTRDVLREEISLDGLPLHIIDTAGLRDSGNEIEREGMRRAWQEIAQADRVLLIVEDYAGICSEDEAIVSQLPAQLPVTVVRNKIDLTGNAAVVQQQGGRPEVRISATEGSGIDLLRDHLKHCMGYHAAGEGGFMARRRHLDALQRAASHLQSGARQLDTQRAGELLAEDLRQAQRALDEITGEFTSEDLLGEIFSSFCIGK
ncbi:MAG: tRNA uridine-5-carboxymethylaminomethyl(34) synthesis GTPase MnmE [Pseudomonadota bacterium]|nr:MAG: tRNA uridine-5-carboxymethylaminomethyl(34) synthesis GTPase MnmE [Pseudomonadota bacterium]